MEKQFYTVKEVAELFSIHINTVAKLITTRKLTAIKVAGVWRISQVAINSYIEQRTSKAKYHE